MDNYSSKISGIWLTTYTYYNSGRDAEFESKHYVRAYSKDNLIIMETIPELNESYMLARFSRDDKILTGTWQEGTNPHGDYQGAIYHGAAQLIISDDGKSIKGKWVGFGKNMDIKTGNWEFQYLGEDVSAILDQAKGQ